MQQIPLDRVRAPVPPFPDLRVDLVRHPIACGCQRLSLDGQLIYDSGSVILPEKGVNGISGSVDPSRHGGCPDCFEGREHF